MSALTLASLPLFSEAINRARVSRHMDRGGAAYAGGRFFSALRRWRVAHSAGSSEAAFRIAELYVKGEGVQRNLAEAVKWYREAAGRGHAEAQFRLGLILLNGALGGEVANWRRAAAAGDEDLAQKNAQALFPSGFEVRPDPVEALQWLEEASRNGVREADSVIGQIYLEGQARPRDFAVARWRLQLAAKAGVASAQFRVGNMLFRGLGRTAQSRGRRGLVRASGVAGQRAGRCRNRHASPLGSGSPERQGGGGRLFRESGSGRRPSRSLPRGDHAAQRRRAAA